MEHPHLRPARGRRHRAQRGDADVQLRRHGRASPLDGLSATAFPSGVHTMPVEATEHTGPIVIWRKELRPDSGGDGEFRGGLGQVIEIEALPRP